MLSCAVVIVFRVLTRRKESTSRTKTCSNCVCRAVVFQCGAGGQYFWYHIKIHIKSILLAVVYVNKQVYKKLKKIPKTTEREIILSLQVFVAGMRVLYDALNNCVVNGVSRREPPAALVWGAAWLRISIEHHRLQGTRFEANTFCQCHPF